MSSSASGVASAPVLSARGADATPLAGGVNNLLYGSLTAVIRVTLLGLVAVVRLLELRLIRLRGLCVVARGGWASAAGSLAAAGGGGMGGMPKPGGSVIGGEKYGLTPGALT